MMPITDPRDRFFYPHHIPMKDTYCPMGEKSEFKMLRVDCFWFETIIITLIFGTTKGKWVLPVFQIS